MVGIVENTGAIGMGSNQPGSEAINEGIIRNTGAIGMRALNDSEAINRGTIENGGEYGMIAVNGGKVTNEEGGIIENNGPNGMGSSFSGSEAINRGIIRNSEDFGMYSLGGGTVINEEMGRIENIGNYRMLAFDSDSEAINRGTLNTRFGGYIVMLGNEGATITNEGTIDVNHNNGIGMRAINGATAINASGGVINLNGSNDIGMNADGTGSEAINQGTINLGGGLNNQIFLATNGGTFTNAGTINSVGALSFNDMGDGRFIMADGGTLEAESLEGDFYASGDLATGGYEDEYSTDGAIRTDNIEGDIISDSYMFDAELTEQDNDGYYDIVLTKKDFSTLVENEQLGRILEDSYEDNGDKLKLNYYDALKLISSQEIFEGAVESSYGMNFYPTIAKQNFDVVRSSNRVISDNVLKLDNDLEIGEVVVIGGGSYDLLEENFESGLKEYDLSLYNVYFGAEKQLNKDISLGGILTLGKIDADYNESGYFRDGYQYQTNIYLRYENDEKLKFTSVLFGGMIDSDIERSLSFEDLHEKMEDSTKDYYVGLNNKLSKRYDIGKNYIEPALEFNITYMMQDDISESGDYGVKIDGVNSTSIETGLGITFGRDIFLLNGNKINLETSAMGYIELGDPYKDLESSFNVLSDEKVKIDGYEGSDYYGDLRIRGSYTTSKLFTLYAEGSYRIESNGDGWGGKVGFIYRF